MVTAKQNPRVTKQGKGETRRTVENQNFTKVDRNWGYNKGATKQSEARCKVAAFSWYISIITPGHLGGSGG